MGVVNSLGIAYFLLGKWHSMHWTDWDSLAKKIREKGNRVRI